MEQDRLVAVRCSRVRDFVTLIAPATTEEESVLENMYGLDLWRRSSISSFGPLV